MPDPTPGFEKMDRAMAERHLRVRAERIQRQVRTLPTDEVLRLALDLHAEGLHGLAADVAEYGAARLRKEAQDA